MGHRWALIVGMLYWTVVKMAQVWVGIEAGVSAGRAVVSHIVWWAVFMYPPGLAFQVERARRRVPHAPETAQDRDPLLHA